MAIENALDEVDLAPVEPRRTLAPYSKVLRVMITKGVSHEEAQEIITQESHVQYGGKPTLEDIALQDERRARLLRLGASEKQAKDGSRDIGAFNATRIYLRGK